jgi:predicted nucleic acid-binding protein
MATLSLRLQSRVDENGTLELTIPTSCIIVQAELYYGAWNSRDPSHNLSVLEQFFQPFSVLREFSCISELVCEDWTC